MTRRLTAPLALMLLLGLIAAAPVAADQNYSCGDNSCAFTVPDSYSVVSNDPTQVIFSDSISGGVFSVVSQDASDLNSLDEAVYAIAKEVATKDGFQPGPDNGKSTILAGNPAILIEYIAKNANGLLVETAIYATLYQGKEYELIFVTTPANEDTFIAGAQDVFDSFQFT